MARKPPTTEERAWPITTWVVVLALLLALAALTSPSLVLLPTYLSYAIIDSLYIGLVICLAATRSLKCLWLLTPLVLLIIIAVILHANPLVVLYKPLVWLAEAVWRLV
mgnify:CR=1 FL=1